MTASIRTGLPFRSTEVGRLWRARARKNSLGHYCKVRGSPLAIYQAAGGTERYTTKRKKRKKITGQFNAISYHYFSCSHQKRNHSAVNQQRASLCWDKEEINMNFLLKQSLLFPRLASNWLCGWGWPLSSTSWVWGLRGRWGIAGMDHCAWFYPGMGSETRTSHVLGKHSTNLSYFPSLQHQLSGSAKTGKCQKTHLASPFILCP